MRRRTLGPARGTSGRRVAPWWVCAIAAVVAAPAAAQQCASTSACLQRLQAAQAQTNTLTARFTQTKHLALLAAPVESKGRLIFERPDHIRLDIDTPDAATIVIRGRDIVIPGLSPQDQAALQAAPIATAMQHITGLFTGSLLGLESTFDVTAEQMDSAIAVELAPRDEALKRAFTHLSLRFGVPDMLIQNLMLEDGLGDRVEIAMHDVQRNVPVAAAVFEVGATAPPR